MRKHAIAFVAGILGLAASLLIPVPAWGQTRSTAPTQPKSAVVTPRPRATRQPQTSEAPTVSRTNPRTLAAPDGAQAPAVLGRSRPNSRSANPAVAASAATGSARRAPGSSSSAEQPFADDGSRLFDRTPKTPASDSTSISARSVVPPSHHMYFADAQSGLHRNTTIPAQRQTRGRGGRSGGARGMPNPSSMMMGRMGGGMMGRMGGGMMGGMMGSGTGYSGRYGGARP
jgi:hypothetical protein